jgi:DNA mismatch repair protein MutS2
MSDFFVTRRSAGDLGWPHVLAALAARTSTARGRELAGALPFLQSREAVEVSLGRVEEGRALLRRNERIPVGGVEDMRAPLARAAKEATLAPAEVLGCARLIAAAAAVRRFLASRREETPGLAALGQGLPDYNHLAQDIEAAIEPSGRIRDTASSTLAELRARALQLHRDIKVRIEAFLHDPAFAPNLQDNYFSVRGDRYVLPINTSFRSKVPGIVHNASQTGQTVFIEPQEVVPLGNELAIAESLAAEEERRILAMFSAELGEASEALLQALERLGALDVTQAAAVLAQDMDAAPATLAQAGRASSCGACATPSCCSSARRWWPTA